MILRPALGRHLVSELPDSRKLASVASFTGTKSLTEIHTILRAIMHSWLGLGIFIQSRLDEL